MNNHTLGANFLLMHDNARPHTVRIVVVYLNNANTLHLKWLPRSPNINPIQHVWDMHDTRNLVPPTGIEVSKN